MTRVVIALDSFKGSITSTDAVSAMVAGWREARPHDELVSRPMADGGEGTLDAFAAAVSGARRMHARVRGLRGDERVASWVLLPGRVGVVELADASGIELLDGDLLPWDADTCGFGQAIAAALDHGVERLVLGIGSSASTDGGVGMLTALGARFSDVDGAPLAPGLRGLCSFAEATLSGLRAAPPGGVVVLCDVTNRLCGAEGAAAVFGPQKGLASADISRADRALARLAEVLGAEEAMAPGAGAAGGTGFALLVWGARMTSGAAEVATLIGVREAIATADLVITGEGAYDRSSAAGKVPGYLAGLARETGVPVALVAGQIAADADLAPFAHAVSLAQLAGTTAASSADPGRWLTEAGRVLAGAWQ